MRETWAVAAIVFAWVSAIASYFDDDLPNEIVLPLAALLCGWTALMLKVMED